MATYPQPSEITPFFLRELYGLTWNAAIWGFWERRGEASFWVNVSDAKDFDPWNRPADALGIIERMHRIGWRYELRGHFEGKLCHFAAFDTDDVADANPLYQELGATPCEAICRAAYKALVNDMSPVGTWWREAGQGDSWKLPRDPKSRPRHTDDAPPPSGVEREG